VFFFVCPPAKPFEGNVVKPCDLTTADFAVDADVLVFVFDPVPVGVDVGLAHFSAFLYSSLSAVH